LGGAAFLAGDSELALEMFARAREGARRPLHRLRALIDLGSAQASLGGSIETLEKARVLAADSGALEHLVRAELAIARVLIHRFELAAAGSHLASSIETARRYKLAILSEALIVDSLRVALIGDASAAERALDKSVLSRTTRTSLAL